MFERTCNTARQFEYEIIEESVIRIDLTELDGLLRPVSTEIVGDWQAA